MTLSQLARQPGPPPEEVCDLADYVCRDFRYKHALGAALLLRVLYEAAGEHGLPVALNGEMERVLRVFRERCPVLGIAATPRGERRDFVRNHHGETHRRLKILFRQMLGPAPAWPHDAGPPEDSRGFGRSRWQVYSEARRNFDDGFDPRTRPDVMPAGRHGYKSRQRRLIWSSYDGGSRW